MMSETEIRFEEISPANFYQCIELKVADGQKRFVAPNVKSIAESKIYPTLTPLAIYNGDEMVGFALYGLDPDSDRFYIVRLMIDARFQGKGFGRAAAQKLIERMSETEECREIYLSFVPENEGAERLYTSLGFERTGEIEHGEIVMRLKL